MDRRAFLKSGFMLTALTSTSGGLISACSNKTLTYNEIATDKIVTPKENIASVQENTVVEESSELPFKKVVKTDEEWKQILTPEQYKVARKGGTEKPFSSPLNKVHEKGTFTCVCCDLALFDSKTKFDSGTGWPSFYAPINEINVSEKVDKSMAETRTEVLCTQCDGHLGHVFDDGPKPTGLRYCMNGVAMKFVKS
jgi:peptide-methionine (R)-S-oxide reductase